MAFKLLCREINVVEPVFYTTEDFYPFLKKNDYAFVRNAFNVDVIQDKQIKDAIYSFNGNEVDETHLYCVESHNELNTFIRESKFINELKKHISPLYIQNSLFLRKKKNLPGYNIHRDGDSLLLKENKKINFSNHKDNEKFVYTIWTALKDVSPENSTLCLLRHEDERLEIENFWNSAGNIEPIDKLFENNEFHNKHKNWISAKMNKGDAVIFSGNIIHASTDGLKGERTSFDIRVSNTDFKDICTYKIVNHNFFQKISIKEISKEEYFVL